MFRITAEVIREEPPPDSAAGAYVVFEGRVRETNEGRRVVGVDYEAHQELALAEGESVLAEARKRYGLLDARCVHRVGRLRVGDTAVWVCATAAHRSEAFAACRYIIDEVKRRVPIWKKEHYAQGGAEWLGGEPLGGSSLTEQTYYSRQVLLPELGIEGQERLRSARVLVVGAGGLGCAALPYLVAAGVGRVSVCDSDVLEASNLHRQVLYSASDIGRPKAELAAERLRETNPFVTVVAHPYRLTDENLHAVVEEHDIVLDCTDNFDTKFSLNDACVALDKPLVQASIYQMEGQVQVIAPGGGCLRCQWPEIPPSGCVGSCAEVGVLGVLPGFFGVLQATEAIKLIVGIGECLTSTLLLVDLRTYQIARLERPRNPACPICGSRPTTLRHPRSSQPDPSHLASAASLTSPSPRSEAEGGGSGRESGSSEPSPPTLGAPSFRSPLSAASGEQAAGPSPSWLVRADCPELRSMTVIDLREMDEEREPVPLVDSRTLHIPMSRFPRELPTLDPGKRYVMVCAHGTRASRLARHLHSRGLTNFLALDPSAYEQR